MSNKADFASRVRQGTTDFANFERMCEELARVFESRGYESGGSDELTQADLDAAGIEATIEDVQTFVTIFDDMHTWLDAAGRRETLDRLRLIISL